MKIKKRIYTKVYNRSFDLVACEIWDKGERVELSKFCNKLMHYVPLCFYVPGKGTDFYFDFSDPKQKVQILEKFCRNNFKLLVSRKKIFDMRCASIREKMRKRSPDDFIELTDLLIKIWPMITVGAEIGAGEERLGYKGDRKLIEFCLTLREESDDVLHGGLNALSEMALRLLSPKYKKYSKLMTIEEITEKKYPSMQELSRRAKGFIFYKNHIMLGLSLTDYAKKNSVMFDDEFSKKDNITELKGQIACMGNIKGIAKLVFEKQDVNKVKDGDIIISPMTTPDFASAMIKAVAFVTDEGGITCHAAIVAREYKKPCIIGTKLATKIIKDGDLIEVDANKGFVRLINGQGN